MTATPLTQMEKATTIPDETLYLVEMGDGSGTKTVTQKTLAEETGKALKVGDLKELQTENKENLVGAINEAARSGGSGVAVDILDSKEEIEANTEPEKVAGALAVKEMLSELNDNMVSNIYVGDDGKLHMVQGGADSVLNFSSKAKHGTFNFDSSGNATINLGQRPKELTIRYKSSNSSSYNFTISYNEDYPSLASEGNYVISDSGFSLNNNNSSAFGGQKAEYWWR